MDENEIAKVIVDSALQVHKALGPGLLESVYERVLFHELRKRGLGVRADIRSLSSYRKPTAQGSG